MNETESCWGHSENTRKSGDWNEISLSGFLAKQAIGPFVFISWAKTFQTQSEIPKQKGMGHCHRPRKNKGASILFLPKQIAKQKDGP